MSSTPSPTELERSDATEPGFGPVLAALCETWAARQGAMLSIKDAASGRYAYVNDAMARFLGRPASQICGHGDAELVDPALVTAWRAAEQSALSQAQPLTSEHRFEWAGQRHDYAVLRLAVDADGQAGADQRADCRTTRLTEQQRRIQRVDGRASAIFGASLNRNGVKIIERTETHRKY